MIYASPGKPGAKVEFKTKYDNFIGGRWQPPVKGNYFDVITPIVCPCFNSKLTLRSTL